MQSYQTVIICQLMCDKCFVVSCVISCITGVLGHIIVSQALYEHMTIFRAASMPDAWHVSAAIFVDMKAMLLVIGKM